MGQSPRQKIALNVSRIKATIPMINNELKQLQSRRKRLIENLSNIADDIAEIDKELAIHRRVSRLNYSRRCAEASAVHAHMKKGLPLAPGMEIGYVIRDARK
jgi:chromosome segregation ATPase